MFSPLHTSRDTSRGQILTPTDAPPASALVGARRGKVRERSLLGGFLCLRVGKLGDRLKYLST